jgi:predicted branched-subunit amino acid permease
VSSSASAFFGGGFAVLVSIRLTLDWIMRTIAGSAVGGWIAAPSMEGMMAPKPISFGQIDRLQVDEDSGRLYWDGHPVVTGLTLHWYERILATAAAIGAVLAGIHPFGITLELW